MLELVKKIEKWANDRNIIKGSKPIDQAMKLFSEFGELADNVGKGRDCRDDIGDVFVVLTIISAQYGESIFDYLSECGKGYLLKGEVVELCENLVSFSCTTRMSFNERAESLEMCIALLNSIALQNGYTLEECVTIAYNDIKDRKGIMSGGIFIKESDPVYAQVIAEIEANHHVG